MQRNATIAQSCTCLESSMCVVLVHQNTVHWLSNPGELNTPVHYQSRERTPNTSAHCILVLELPVKTPHSQVLDGILLYSYREETKQDQLLGCTSVPCGYWGPPPSSEAGVGQ